MRTIVEVKEVENEGFIALLGKNVEIFCGVYIYAGKLVGVGQTCVKLADPYLVYETGAFTDQKYKDAQAMGREYHYVSMQLIESFGETHKL
jgi:O-phosphoseryl-tRNA(Cys) synthetase